jgi:pyruvate dehydrogenase E1 component alpha subunit
MHTTADDPKRYRTEGEQQKWEARDPIKRFRAYLERKGIWTEQWQHELEERATKEISEAIAKAESIAPHVPEHLFENMYAEMPEELKEQLEYLKRSLETKEIDDDADQIQGGFP